MHFTTGLFATLLLISSSFATTDTVSYDQTYDSASASLSTVACSDGPNGLLTKGYTTFDSLPIFPYIGGASAIAGWDSASCGSCWKLEDPSTNVSIYIIAIDHTESGFNIALEAMNVLTDNQAVFLGRINVTATEVSASDCGL